MKHTSLRLLMVVMIVALAGCSLPSASTPPATSTPQAPVALSSPAPTDTLPPPSPTAPATSTPEAPAADAAPETQPPSSPTPSVEPAASPTPPPTPAPAADPFDLISQESLFAFLEDLTAIQPFSGWRNSASEGEAEAFDYVAQQLGAMGHLQSLGLDTERQSFHVFQSTEIRETGLRLTVDGQEAEVPADALRGPRDDLPQALRFDSDGAFNDAEPDPVVVEGSVLVVGSAGEIQGLDPDNVRGKVVLLDYAAVDRSIMPTQDAVIAASQLMEKEPAGVVLVTRFSNQPGESHGAFVGDNSALNWVRTEAAPPILYVRLEDLAPLGIGAWDDLEGVEAARMTWDVDLFSPGTSGNLVAHIPGADPSRAMILGAHIDSPNAPGAMDDGSGSVVLLEVARVLDAAGVQPPTDLYLVWFGSEEIGLYGAYHFVTTHQELLDRTLAMLQIDCLTRPLDGISADLRLATWPYGRFGDARLVWPETLTGISARQGIETVPYAAYHVYSDNSTFGGFDVPHADLIYEPDVGPNASPHYNGHLHDPYDTVDLARDVGDVLEEMARVALAAAVEAPQGDASQRITPPPERRALFVASHTEATHMTPAGFTELGMALAMEGFDVDLIPYGQAVTPADLADADLVVVLPVLDYPTSGSDIDLYDEAWTAEEVDALDAYAADGGLLVLTNSRHRLKYGTGGLDPNEDWSDANALASRFGVTYQEGTLEGVEARTDGDHPLVEGLRSLEMGEHNGVPFGLGREVEAEALARAGGDPAIVLLDYDQGQVLVLADVGFLTAGWTDPPNLPFWQNLARYARSR